jgi:hypothetical protein
LGDIVISVETAARQAEERCHPLAAELRILLVHGLLHLLGYDHETCSEDLEEVRGDCRRGTKVPSVPRAITLLRFRANRRAPDRSGHLWTCRWLRRKGGS